MESLVSRKNLFSGVYQGKRVLITGHSGFKGSWLAVWLKDLGAQVIGYSAYLPSKPCNFTVCNLERQLTDIQGDVRNYQSLEKVFSEYKPEIVFHLAAQSIVRTSYDDPKRTFDTNLGGTVNVLECIRKSPCVKTAVIITSDKCYRNFEWDRGYREDDKLGGADPYSASKGCAEFAFYAYNASYFNDQSKPKVVTTRAGNVIGGGDWACDRIIPDCVRAISLGEELVVRNPQATRPWQFVLEPLSGYLWLGAYLLKNPDSVAGESFNFGPEESQVQSVEEVVDSFFKYYDSGKWRIIENQSEKKESKLLKLSCQKALKIINWRPVLRFNETIKFTADWYKEYLNNNKDMYDFSIGQINSYIKEALAANAAWLKPGALND